ncbi:MAG: hypothetical protein LBP53_02950 [Candidatus Peribacteria bacterium]|nr:hypothetical protein [Candidatus Peribacteria bacterium]
MQTKNTKCNLYSPKLILYAQHNRRQDTMTQTEGLVWNCILKGRKML